MCPLRREREVQQEAGVCRHVRDLFNRQRSQENYVGIVGLSSGEYYRDSDERVPALFLPGAMAVEYLKPKLSRAKVWEGLRAFPEDRMMLEPCDQWATAGE